MKIFKLMYKMIVWTLILRNDEVLLLKKSNNEEWTAVGGHVEDNESIKMAAAREIKEEVDVVVNENDLNMLCMIDRKLDNAYKFHMFFYLNNWQGEFNNQEPEIHSEMKWFKLNDLPNNLGILVSSAIESLESNQLYYFKDHADEREVDYK